MAKVHGNIPSSDWGNKSISTHGQKLSNFERPSYGKALHGSSHNTYTGPVNLENSVTMNRRPTAGPVDGAHPNAKVQGKGSVSAKG